MNIKKVSVIVPIYNAELYIRECLDSLKAQTFSDYEIVMVNDGSSDSSVEICKSFCKNDDRFVLLNQENAGVCAARNNGVKNSSGGYIAFVDADDKVESDYLEVLYRAVIDAGADIAMCDFYDDSGKEGQVTVTQTIEDKNEMFDLYWGGVIYNRVMNKIYRRNIVESVLFPVDRQLMEDAYWTSKVLSLSHRITILPEAKYYYRKVNGSLSHRKKYTQFQKAGMHRNKLEKYRLLATYCSDKLIESKLGDLERELNYIFISNNDLSMFDVINCVRQLICMPIFTTCHNKSFNYIRSNLYSNHLHERYLLRLIFRINSNLKIRILALHRLIKMKER